MKQSEINSKKFKNYNFQKERYDSKVIAQDLEENDLEAVMYQAPSVSTSNTGGGGRRFIPSEVFLSQELINIFDTRHFRNSQHKNNFITRLLSEQVKILYFINKCFWA